MAMVSFWNYFTGPLNEDEGQGNETLEPAAKRIKTGVQPQQQQQQHMLQQQQFFQQQPQQQQQQQISMAPQMMMQQQQQQQVPLLPQPTQQMNFQGMMGIAPGANGAQFQVPILPVPTNQSVQMSMIPQGVLSTQQPMPNMASASMSLPMDNNSMNNSTMMSTTGPGGRTNRKETRRIQNAAHSRRSRAKKKTEELELQLEFKALQRENERLKAIVKAEIPDDAQEIIGECCYKPHAKGHFHGDQASALSRSDFALIENLSATRQSFVITDPRLPDNPIVYASGAFLELVGYTRDQVVGRNCRFLQGIDTDPKSLEPIRKAIETGGDGAACILNYKSDGRPFWNNFFIAALRDRKNQIVNYVGVQTEVNNPADDNEDNLQPDEIAPKSNSDDEASVDGKPVAQPSMSAPATFPVQSTDDIPPIPIDSTGTDIYQYMQPDTEAIDWAELAVALEGGDDQSVSTVGESSFVWEEENLEASLDALEAGQLPNMQSTADEAALHYHSLVPRDYVQRTLRSEMIQALLSADGDVENKRFTSALDILSQMYKSTLNSNTSTSPLLNAEWKSISRPSYHYGGFIGTTDGGEAIYTLGRMCFGMFKPGNLRVTVQNTMNRIEPVCQMDQAPAAAPWSLRRELALQEDPESSLIGNTMLKAYDVIMSFTIEPGQLMASKNENIPSPPCRLRATQIVHGFFLPDPETPNRLTVWFTGGELRPAPPPAGDSSYGGLQEWIEVFGAEHKRTWGESLGILGAKLFLGAELPDGMKEDGSMSYMLHRPYGGHGKGYVDVMYMDSEVLVTKGNSGTVHVMTKQQEDEEEEEDEASN